MPGSSSKTDVTPAIFFGLWTFRSHALSFPGTKRPHSECSFPGTNVWTFRFRNETAYSNFRALERLSKPNEEKE